MDVSVVRVGQQSINSLVGRKRKLCSTFPSLLEPLGCSLAVECCSMMFVLELVVVGWVSGAGGGGDGCVSGLLS